MKENERQQLKYFEYLDDLRDSGETNMLGSIPYLMKEFDLDRDKAKKILLKWIESFQNNGKIVKVKSCARCGNDHKIEFYEFSKSSIGEYNFWGICQIAMEPVLMKIENKDKSSRSAL